MLVKALRAVSARIGLKAIVGVRKRKRQISKDPKFEEKVRNIVGLYLNPPNRDLVLCVDEKSQIQALDRTAPILPWRPDLLERQTHNYKRHGTTTPNVQNRSGDPAPAREFAVAVKLRLARTTQ